MARPSLVARAKAGWRAFAGGTARVAARSYYAAAQSGRLVEDWFSSLLDPADETKASGEKLRGRVRDLRRNTPLVARYAQLVEENLIGPDGITLQAIPGNSRKSVNRQLAQQNEATWYAWTTRAALDGRDWDATCRQLAEAWRVEGEGLIELVYDDRLPLGVGVQLLDADLIVTKLDQRRDGSRAEIVQGVQLDDLGAIAGVWVYRRHPASMGGGGEPRFIPADRCRLLAHRPRIGMIRGVTPLAPVMLRLQMLNGVQEALVMLHRVAATKMGWFVRTQTDADTFGDPSQPTQPVNLTAEPLNVDYAPDGYDFKPWDPGQPTQQYDPFRKSLVQEIAAGMGVAYASLTGDLSQANYGSQRGGLLSERDRWRVLQREFAAVVCQWVYEAVLKQARIRGQLQRPADLLPDAMTAAVWHGRKWEWIDPPKDIGAEQQAVASGFTTITRVLNARGLDIREVFEERAEELRLAKELGIPLQEAPPAPVDPEGEDAPAPDDKPAPDESDDEDTPPQRSMRVA